ncbi:MAG: cyclic nucleotide-binding domain-containing protein [Bacteroidetes bacterium]|nr:cyclic nucleotide-binding domain-containing protein [Bacteroidota bacterium]
MQIPDVLLACLMAVLATCSLFFGAATSLFWTPKQKMLAMLLAFGGGALLAPMTIDLVGGAIHHQHFPILAAGCLSGGIIFFLLNDIVNNNGGFLRKTSTTIEYLKKKKSAEYKYISKKMSQVPLFHKLPPEEINDLVPYVISRKFQKGSTIMRQGDPGDSLVIIDSGEVEIVDERNQKKLAILKENDAVGELALLTGEPRTATAVSAGEVNAFIILKEHFDRLMKASPELESAVKELASTRISELKEKKSIAPEKAEEWFKKTVRNLEGKVHHPTDTEIKEAHESKGGAGLAVWVGNLLDVLPASVIIGSNPKGTGFALLAGLFLCNYPEALSSSVGMKQQKMSSGKILWMWTSLVLVTAVGAILSNIGFSAGPSEILITFIEGVAAGAMLTMIAEIMLPEAYHLGGSVTGFSTLIGFLASAAFSAFDAATAH